jgi:TonB family protein
VGIVAEPVSAPRLAQLAGKIPLLRRIGHKDKATAPVPLYQAQPSLRIPDTQNLLQPASVAVKVYVAESGAVKRAEVVVYGDPPNWNLANASLAAARKWTFQPARIEQMPVSSEVILHFRFNP